MRNQILPSSFLFLLSVFLLESAVNPAQDGDRDGLLDKWERRGYDADGDGVIDEPLHKWGADPSVQDVFVEIDWMGLESGPSGFGKRLRTIGEMLGTVFSRHGINLHMDIGPEGAGTPFTGCFGAQARGGTVLPFRHTFRARPGSSFSQGEESLYTVFNDPLFFRSSRRNIFYYVFFAVQKSAEEAGTAEAERFRDRAAQALGLRDPGVYSVLIYRRAFQRNAHLAATLIHELGHCFGLGHGGRLPGGGWDNTLGKVNYISVMNPLYQLSSNLPAGVGPLLDFSNGSAIPVTEAAVDERRGLGPGFGKDVLIRLGVSRARSSSFPWNVDWNGNGVVERFVYPYDLNGDGVISGELWRDHDDWGWLKRCGFNGIGCHAYRADPCGSARPSATPEFLLANVAGGKREELIIRRGRSLWVFRIDNTGPVLIQEVELPAELASRPARLLSAQLTEGPGSDLILQSEEGLFVLSGEKQNFMVKKFSDLSAPAPAGRTGVTDKIYFADFEGDGREIPVVQEGAALYRLKELGGMISLGPVPSPGADLRFAQGACGIFFVDFNGDSRESMLAVCPTGALLCSLKGGRVRLDHLWLGAISTEDTVWPFHYEDSHFFEDVDGDGIRDWVIWRGNGIGVFLNTPEGPAVEGYRVRVKISGEGGPCVFKWGDFLEEGGRELVICRGEQLFLVHWDGEKVSSSVLNADRSDTGLEEMLKAETRLLSLSWNGREALAFLAPDSVTVVELDPLRGKGFEIPLRKWGLWPCGEISVLQSGSGQKEIIMVSRGERFGFIVNGDDFLKLQRVCAWNVKNPGFSVVFPEETAPPIPFLRGDSNLDGAVDLSDVVCLLKYLFGLTGKLKCEDSSDANDTGRVDIGDAVYVLNYLFAAAPPPPPPGPHKPGLDPTPDNLSPCLQNGL